MAVNLWLRAVDEELFKGIHDRGVQDVTLSEYCTMDLENQEHAILTGILENEGSLSKVSKKFVLGRKGIWKPRYLDQEFPHVLINKHSLYKGGLVLTPYSEQDVKFHLGTKTIDQTTDYERVELFGNEQRDFVERVFWTYYGHPDILKPKGKDKHFVLYFVDK